MSRYNAVFLLGAMAIGSFSDPQKKGILDISTPLTARRWVSTVDCYSCVTYFQIRDQTAVKTCPYNPDAVKSKTCIKFADKLLRLNSLNRTWVMRGCATDKGYCDELRPLYALNPGVELDYCTECEGDKCNGASRSIAEKFFAFFTVIFVPIFAKYILS